MNRQEPKECFIERHQEYHKRACAEDDPSGYYTHYRCSNCKANAASYATYKFCPECGYKIVRKKKDE